MDFQQVVDKPVVPVVKGKWFESVVVALVHPVATVVDTSAAAEAVDTAATDHAAVQVVSTQKMLVV